jgi:transglutaminase-like putative cysteine protease
MLAAAAAIHLPAPALAQAPVITEKGDPSVNSDTIYSLVVSPANHPEDPHVLLLDDGVIRLERDGTSSTTYRMVAQVLKQEAIQTWAEHTFSYDAGREVFRLNWARVLDADGSVVAERPLHMRESDARVPESYPVYTQNKVVRISLSNVSVGRIVDYSYTIETKDPVLPGDWWSSWAITLSVPVRRSRLIVDVPADAEPRFTEHNLDFAPAVQRVRDRVVRTWYRADIPSEEGEMFAAAEGGPWQWVVVSGRLGWADIGTWYAGLVRDHYTMTPGLDEALAYITEGALTRLDSLRAVHRFIAQDIRYISLSLGAGGYTPRRPDEVLATMSGDCKDKAVLFVALARRMGWDAYPVLVAASGSPRRELPSLYNFDHMIAAVRESNGDWIYLDLTADIIPFGETPASVAGEFGLLVRDDGGIDEVTMPALRADANRIAHVLDGRLTADGRFEGRYDMTASGFHQYDLRSTFAQSFEGRARTELTHGIASNILTGAQGDDLLIFDGFDLDAEPRVGLRLTADRQFTRAGSGWIFRLPMDAYVERQTVDALEREPARRSAFDAGSVVGPQAQETVIRLTLPDGWTAALPESFTAQSAFGRYEASYTQHGPIVTLRRALSGVSGTLPKEHKTELVEWLRRIADDDATFIMLTPAP